MWLMLQQEQADDYVIATGQNNSLREFAQVAFGCLDLDFDEHTVTDSSLFRPADIAANRGNPGKAAKELGWEPRTFMAGVAERMVEAELQRSDS